MKRILIGAVAMIMAMPCFAEDTPATGDKRITSKPYVENAVATRQDKIPAANLSNTNYGETVMTYTPNGDGEIGERALFTGGEYDASTDADKLITASALDTAFTTLPETPTTKLVCANQSDGCTLWTITDQTAYGISGNGTTTIDLTSLIGNIRGTGYTSNNSIGAYYFTQDMSNSIISGDPMAFAVDYGDKGMIKGHGRCSSQSGTGVGNGASGPEAVTTTSTLPDSSGPYCYCTLEGYTPLNGNMTVLSAPWVFGGGTVGWSGCADECAVNCAMDLWYDNTRSLMFRAAVFGSVQ